MVCGACRLATKREHDNNDLSDTQVCECMISLGLGKRLDYLPQLTALELERSLNNSIPPETSYSTSNGNDKLHLVITAVLESAR